MVRFELQVRDVAYSAMIHTDLLAGGCIVLPLRDHGFWQTLTVTIWVVSIRLESLWLTTFSRLLRREGWGINEKKTR
jgi:hypothetical protein